MRAIALLLLAVLPTHAALAQITEAKVTGGLVSGVSEGGIGIFKGIPFAAPPVGALRWKAPAPVRHWSAYGKPMPLPMRACRHRIRRAIPPRSVKTVFT